MKSVKTSELIGMENLCHSITVSPQKEGGYLIEYFFKEKTKKGIRKTKSVKVDTIEEDIIIPTISNWTVAHLGYGAYQYHKTENFYINFYKFKTSTNP